jgi:hypothetical protein
MKVKYIGRHNLIVRGAGEFKPGDKEVDLTPEQENAFIGAGAIADDQGYAIFEVNGKTYGKPRPKAEAKPDHVKKDGDK